MCPDLRFCFEFLVAALLTQRTQRAVNVDFSRRKNFESAMSSVNTPARSSQDIRDT
jgi:hypothetical protein